MGATMTTTFCAMILDKLDGMRRATGAEAGVCEALA